MNPILMGEPVAALAVPVTVVPVPATDEDVLLLETADFELLPQPTVTMATAASNENVVVIALRLLSDSLGGLILASPLVVCIRTLTETDARWKSLAVLSSPGTRRVRRCW